ncbi:hypothetical protein DOY81_000267, partial [Sarcophaga bullata]
YLQYGAHLCCVIKPCDANKLLSSAPFSKNTTGFLSSFSEMEMTLNVSNIITIMTPASAAAVTIKPPVRIPTPTVKVATTKSGLTFAPKRPN